jgi:hypothetical protein
MRQTLPVVADPGLQSQQMDIYRLPCAGHLRGGDDDECDKEDRKPDEFERDRFPELSGPRRRSSAAAATTGTGPARPLRASSNGAGPSRASTARRSRSPTGTTYTTAVATAATCQTIDARLIKLAAGAHTMTVVWSWPRWVSRTALPSRCGTRRHDTEGRLLAVPDAGYEPLGRGGAPPCGKYGTKEGTMPTKSKAKRSLPRMSPEVKAAYTEIQRGVRNLGKSIAEIQQGLRKAEREIEAAARARIQALRKEVRAQLAGLEKRRRDVGQTLKRLASAAGESSQDIKRSAESALAEARATADSVIERFRRALGA